MTTSHKTLDGFDQIIADINAGKGTVGKILKTDELSDEIKATIARLDVTLDKINNGHGTVGRLLNESGAVRESGRDQPRDARAAEGFPRESEEIPDHSTENVLSEEVGCQRRRFRFHARREPRNRRRRIAKASSRRPR